MEEMFFVGLHGQRNFDNYYGMSLPSLFYGKKGFIKKMRKTPKNEVIKWAI